MASPHLITGTRTRRRTRHPVLRGRTPRDAETRRDRCPRLAFVLATAPRRRRSRGCFCPEGVVSRAARWWLPCWARNDDRSIGRGDVQDRIPVRSTRLVGRAAMLANPAVRRSRPAAGSTMWLEKVSSSAMYCSAVCATFQTYGRVRTSPNRVVAAIWPASSAIWSGVGGGQSSLRGQPICSRRLRSARRTGQILWGRRAGRSRTQDAPRA